MKKLFKKLSLVLLTVCAAFACAFAVTACGEGNDKVESTNYVFVIQNSDGSAFKSTASYQICTDSTCNPITNVTPDSNGKLTLTQQQVNALCNSETDVTKFSFHVIGAEGYKYDCSFEIDGVKEYTCKLSVAE